MRGLLIVNMGATAVGTGLNAKPEYVERVMFHLKGAAGIPVEISEHLVDGTQNMDAYTELSASLKVCAVNLSKICNDIRMMASGPRAGLGELKLPPKTTRIFDYAGKSKPCDAGSCESGGVPSHWQ